MRFKAPFLVVSAFAALTACGDYRTPTAPLRPGETPPLLGISDGVHSLGNQGFFFLPPLVRQPDGSEFGDSPFKANAAPHIEICLLKVNPADVQPLATAICEPGLDPVETFSSSQISVGSDQYHVNWHTDESDLSPGSYYRVTVFVGTQMLGFADVQPVATAKELRNPKTGDIIMLVDGRTLPIKFRIEQEAVCEFGVDCVKKRISETTGGVVTTPSGDASVIFPANFLPDNLTEIEVTIQRVPLADPQTCHTASGEAQTLAFVYGECYEVTTVPSLFDGQGQEGLQTNVIWVQCSALNIPEDYDNFVQIFKSDPPARGGLRALEEVRTPAGFCVPQIGQVPAPGEGALAMVKWRLDQAVRQVTGLVIPKPAYAIDLGLGGLILGGDGFSRFQRGIGARIESTQENRTITVPPGGTATARVRVEADKHDHPTPDTDDPVEEHEHAPIARVDVVFEMFESDGDRIGIETVSTDVEGIAQATFPVGNTPDVTFAIRATTRAEGSPVEFTVNVTAPTGSISGTVFDDGESPLSGVGLTLVEVQDDRLVTRTATTGQDGGYSFPALPSGRHWLTAALTGFDGAQREVLLKVGATLDVDLFLTEVEVDQDNNPDATTSTACQTTGLSLFQSFTPSSAAVLALDLLMRDGGSFPATGTTTTVRIRTQGPAGPIAGSATAFVTPGGVGVRRLIRFHFQPALDLSTGVEHFIEWVSPTPAGVNADAVLTWLGLFESQDENPSYSGGSMYTCGGGDVVSEPRPSIDLNFKTFTIVAR
jgi:hypothetical protein